MATRAATATTATTQVRSLARDLQFPAKLGSAFSPGSARADSALKWDAGSGRPKLSWQHAVALHRPTAFTARALIEWTLTRRIALLSQAPPVGVGEQALAQLAEDLYAVDQVKAVRTVFKPLPHFPHVPTRSFHTKWH